MIKFLKQLFTWWNGETLNTRFAIWDKSNWDIQARVTETGSSRSYRRLDERGIVL